MPAPVASVMALALAAAPLLTLLLAAWVVGRTAEQAAPRAGLSRVAIADLTTMIVITTVVSARILAVAPTWRGIVANPWDMLRFTGSGQLSPLGGALGASLGLLVFTWRRGLPLLRTADLYGLVLPLGMAVYSGGCLLRGDCYGRVAPAPFGIVFPGFAFPHYPVGLYAAASALFVYAGVQWFAQRQPPFGSVALVAVTTLLTADALLAPLRLDTVPGVLEGRSAILLIALGTLITAQVTWLYTAHRARALASSGRDGSPGEERG
jgi:prolipoprotein diacylglyceryltransferase